MQKHNILETPPLSSPIKMLVTIHTIEGTLENNTNNDLLYNMSSVVEIQVFLNHSLHCINWKYDVNVKH